MICKLDKKHWDVWCEICMLQSYCKTNGVLSKLGVDRNHRRF